MARNAFTRRSLLQRTLVGAAAASMHVAHASDDKAKLPIRVAVMGVNSRGKQLLQTLVTFPDVEVAYICDPDSAVVPPAVKIVTDAGKPAPKVAKDFRTALEDKSLDVLVCSAPDHWHAPAAMLACQAGKDVYVEKPCSHNIVEGRRAVQSARKFERTVQVGMQRRSAPATIAAIDKLRAGAIGKVHFVRAWVCGVRPNIGKHQVSEPPSNLDFSLWAGPAVGPAYKRNLVHYHWHWNWLYGTGECGNNGVHYLDVARWGIGQEAPRYVVCGGDKYSFDDDQETPDTQMATFDFAGCAVQWEHRTWSDKEIDGGAGGVVFYGADGTLSLINDRWSITKSGKVVEKGDDPKKADWVASHFRDFFDCRESKKLPRADIEVGHRSASLCHLANIAWRTRSTIKFDGVTETIAGNSAASALLAREYRPGFELPAIS